MNLENLKEDLEKAQDPQKAKNLARFFKTGKGEYGEGDIFLGITVPKQRIIAKKYAELNLDDLQILLSSKIHEQRLTSLLILIYKYNKADEINKEKIFKFYLKNTKYINNWDLVDLSAPNIIGNFLLKLPTTARGISQYTPSEAEILPKRNNVSAPHDLTIRGFREGGLNTNRSVLYKLARSKNLWEKRIAVLASFYFIKNNQFEDSLKIAEILLTDKHDLIHKAVGWMLREIGKKNQEVEENFLKKNYKKMPRIMLRYAIEKFSEEKRKFYLS